MNTQIQNTKKTGFMHSLYFKLLVIMLLILLLWIPTGIVRGLIWERQSNFRQVNHEIASSWGGEQLIGDPVLIIPYEKTNYDEVNDRYWKTEHKKYITSKEVQLNADIHHEIRKKSIYETILYKTALDISGNFDYSFLKESDEILYLYDEARVVVPISDPGGIKQSVSLSYNGSKTDFKPGSGTHSVKMGIHADISLNAKTEDSIDYSFQLDLRGFRSLQFNPSAASSLVNVKGDWPHPGFVGKVLADTREIDDQGFRASWSLSEFNRLVPDYWSDTEYSLGDRQYAYGIELINPVNQYQKNDRTAKYALLIIGLTFLVFFFTELINKKKFHPIQYALVGLSLTLFYYLLLSLSEHVGFNMAYLIACMATLIMILGYCRAMFRESRSLLVLASILAALYSYIFVLIQLEYFALLAGSVGLFVMLALIMYLSRKIDWYNLH